MTKRATVRLVSAGLGIVGMAAVLAILGLPKYGNRPWNQLSQQVKDVKTMASTVQDTFAEGKLVAQTNPWGRPDARLSIIYVALNKIRFGINKHETNEAKREAALSDLAAAQKVLDDLLPKFGVAKEMNDLAAAKDFGGYMTALQQHLDDLLKVLQS